MTMICLWNQALARGGVQGRSRGLYEVLLVPARGGVLRRAVADADFVAFHTHVMPHSLQFVFAVKSSASSQLLHAPLAPPHIGIDRDQNHQALDNVLERKMNTGLVQTLVEDADDDST